MSSLVEVSLLSLSGLWVEQRIAALVEVGLGAGSPGISSVAGVLPWVVAVVGGRPCRYRRRSQRD